MDITLNNDLLNLSGKTAIVTGGSSGIGYATAYRLAEAGANVVIVGRSIEDAQKAASEISKKGWVAKAVRADVSIEADVTNLIDQTIKLFDSIDILVNNAGIFPIIPLSKMTENDFNKVISINLNGVFLCTKYVSEKMINQGRGGKIINITSIDTLRPSMVGLAHYDASKHGVLGFSKNIALELAPYNITVNTVAPGGIETPGIEKNNGIGQPGNSSEYLNTKPLKRMGDPDEVAKVILFLASDMSSYMTGSQIVVDGGALLT